MFLLIHSLHRVEFVGIFNLFWVWCYATRFRQLFWHIRDLLKVFFVTPTVRVLSIRGLDQVPKLCSQSSFLVIKILIVPSSLLSTISTGDIPVHIWWLIIKKARSLISFTFSVAIPISWIICSVISISWLLLWLVSYRNFRCGCVFLTVPTFFSICQIYSNTPSLSRSFFFRSSASSICSSFSFLTSRWTLYPLIDYLVSIVCSTSPMWVPQ